MLFHLTTRSAWEAAQRCGVYETPSLTTEGFIHLSTEAQWRTTLTRFFADQPDVVLLTLDETRFLAELRYEDSYGHGVFPHLYGPLNLDAIVSVAPVRDRVDRKIFLEGT